MNCVDSQPECATNSTMLVHTAVTDNSTTYHYLLGTAGYPTILIALGTNPGNCSDNLDLLHVDQSEYYSSQRAGSVRFKNHFSFDHDYSFALIFRSLVQFNIYDSEANDSFCSSSFNSSFWSSEKFVCNYITQTYADVSKTAKQTYCVEPLSDINWGYLNGVSMSGEKEAPFAANQSTRLDIKVSLACSIMLLHHLRMFIS